MTKKKLMKKSKIKLIKWTSEIEYLHACVQADQARLNNAYKISMAAVDKALSKVVSVLDKIKKKAAKEKQGKQKSINIKTASSLKLVQADFEMLLKEKNFLNGCYKKFIAQKKLLI